MIRKKPAPVPVIAHPPAGIRKKLGIAPALAGYAMHPCVKCDAEAGMRIVPGGFQARCTKCAMAGEVRSEEWVAATVWNVTECG